MIVAYTAGLFELTGEGLCRDGDQTGPDSAEEAGIGGYVPLLCMGDIAVIFDARG